VSLSVDDVDAAEEFYGQKLGLRKLYRFGDLTFFDCTGLRLFLEKSRSELKRICSRAGLPASGLKRCVGFLYDGEIE
jgi:catechol 2,3-dioxygenase-like lactoylglutathione lyase family enzyme